MLTKKSWEHLGLENPNLSEQPDLLDSY